MPKIRKELKLTNFIKKLYQILGEPKYAQYISWSDDGVGFFIHDPILFTQNVIPIFFSHKSYNSFVRQLNFYSFRRGQKGIDSGGHKSQYYFHENFTRGDYDGLVHIRRSTSHYTKDAESDTKFQQKINEVESKLVTKVNQIENIVMALASYVKKVSDNHGNNVGGASSNQFYLRNSIRQQTSNSYISQLLTNPFHPQALLSTPPSQRQSSARIQQQMIPPLGPQNNSLSANQTVNINSLINTQLNYKMDSNMKINGNIQNNNQWIYNDKGEPVKEEKSLNKSIDDGDDDDDENINDMNNSDDGEKDEDKQGDNSLGSASLPYEMMDNDSLHFQQTPQLYGVTSPLNKSNMFSHYEDSPLMNTFRTPINNERQEEDSMIANDYSTLLGSPSHPISLMESFSRTLDVDNPEDNDNIDTENIQSEETEATTTSTLEINDKRNPTIFV